MGYIYRIINKINNKCYIGQTKVADPNKRWIGHKNAIKAGAGCPLLGVAINKYGIDNFIFKVLIICFDEDMNKYEKEYIKKFNSFGDGGYNASAGGEPGGTFRGHTHTPETIARWKEKIKKTHESTEYKKMRSELAKAYYANPENRAKHAERMKEVANSSKHIGGFNGRKGRTLSDETKEKIRASVNNYYSCNTSDSRWSETNREKHSKILTKVNGRKVARYDQNGILVNSYDTIKEAAKANNISTGSVWTYINKDRKEKGIYNWKYADEGGLKTQQHIGVGGNT